MAEIVVAPAAVGGSVRLPGVIEPLMFLSGRAAEGAARRLADCLSAFGQAMDVAIHLRDGTLAARMAYRLGGFGRTPGRREPGV
jgi:hypothetical protein